MAASLTLKCGQVDSCMHMCVCVCVYISDQICIVHKIFLQLFMDTFCFTYITVQINKSEILFFILVLTFISSRVCCTFFSYPWSIFCTTYVCILSGHMHAFSILYHIDLAFVVKTNFICTDKMFMYVLT